MKKNNKNNLTMEELYGFADENFVFKLQEKYANFFKKGLVLDLACGRGIFLKILNKNNIEAVGVDNSKEVVEYTSIKGLTIYQSDVFTFLDKAIREGKKYSGIFCSHFIEHLSCDKARKLLSLCFDVLNPGGVLIMITPNPQDLRVITDIFWLDQTHVRPYPLDLLKTLFLKSGFKINELGIDRDTKLTHFKNHLFDKLSKLFFSKTPLGVYLNTGNDIYIVGEKSLPR